MSDPKQKLTEAQVREAELSDWRQVLSTLQARFATGDFATGLAFVDRIGAAAEAANHHPDIVLTYPTVKITLSSHDVGGLTSRDLDLARTISDYAAEAGISADTSTLTQVELGLDTPDGSEVVDFWAALTGAKVKDGEVHDPSGQVPSVWFQDPDPAYQRAEGEVEQRWHLDVWVPHDEGLIRVEQALAAGGTLVDDSSAPSFWVLADAQGNRACVCTPLARPSTD
jgi:4a-hydroxytetrahydrobiopterin dehydratase